MLLVLVLGQLLVLAVTAVFCVVHDRNFLSVFSSWDAHHYLAIAEHGYLFSSDPTNLQSPAFFPGYPVLVWSVPTFMDTDLSC